MPNISLREAFRAPDKPFLIDNTFMIEILLILSKTTNGVEMVNTMHEQAIIAL